MMSLLIVIPTLILASPPDSSPPAPPAPIVLSDDGGWCWFEDPRVVRFAGKLVVGTVAAGRVDPARKGDIEALVYDPASGATTRVELHDRLSLDDHNSPVFLPRPDGRLLVVYAKHGPEDHFYHRISEPNDPTRWGPIETFTPNPKARITYQNLFRLADEGGRVYDFFRGIDGRMKPSYAWSDDDGTTWNAGGVVIDSAEVRPYVRYASDGRAKVHLVYTEGHPRDSDNSLYHVVYWKENLYTSDGKPIRTLKEGLREPTEGTRIFAGDADHVAWPCDVELDAQGRPVVAYSVQVGSGGLPPRQGGDDIRYRYARFDGNRWHDHALAFAGTRLYAGEDDYSGLVTIDPNDVNRVWIATNADPRTGQPLASAADGRRHYEVFRGTTSDGGASWAWTPITRDSAVDNLRPIAADWGDGRTALLWLRGALRAYTDYDLEVVGLLPVEP